jgi:hypothetical protein
MELNQPIYFIGIGDTTLKKDVILKELKFNNVAYKGNKYLIRADIQSNGFIGTELSVLLKENDQVLQRKRVNTTKLNQFLAIEFVLDAVEKGLKKYTVVIENVPDEFSTLNNAKDAYIEIVENKEKILLVSAMPHPDIKAIVNALETNQNYEIITHIVGINEYKKDKYDLVILYQIPNFTGIGNDILKEVSDKKQSVLFVIGNQSNTALIPSQYGFSVKQRSRQTDLAQAILNTDFSRFSVEKDWNNIVAAHPPLMTPFAEITLGSGFDILLYQKINKIATQKPLLALKNDGNNSVGVVFGEGMWMWRMNEFKENEGTEVFDKLWVKVAQFLSSKDDKRKFRMFPREREWFSFDNIIFEAEVFNDLYEPLYNQQISLNITSLNGKNKQFSFTNLAGLNTLDIGNLSSGIYKYKATAVINGKVEESVGDFTVKELQLEMLNTTADFQLLRNMAENTNGFFVTDNEIEKLIEKLKSQEFYPRAYADEDLKEFVHIKWFFIILLLLVSTEWFVRKFKGSY